GEDEVRRVAFAARENEADLATRDGHARRASAGLADHWLEDRRNALDRQPQAAVRRGTGYRPAGAPGPRESAALRALQSHREVLPRGHEGPAPSLFCGD